MGGRFWLAIILCMGVWYGYLTIYPPATPVSAPQAQVEGQASANGQTEASSQPAPAAPSAGAVTSPTGTFGVLSDTKQIQAIPRGGSLISGFETPRYRTSFRDVGGKVGLVELKDYTEKVDEPLPLVSPVDLRKFRVNFASFFSDSRLSPLTQSEYELVQNNGTQTEFSKTLDALGVKIKKSYSKTDKPYQIQAKFRIEVPVEKARENWGTFSIALGGENLDYDYNVPTQAWEMVLFQNDELERKPVSDIEGEEIFRGNTKWLSFGNRYFTSVIVNESKINPDVILINDGVNQGGNLRFPLIPDPQTGVAEFAFTYFVGPKKVEYLESIAGLRALIDYGMFQWLAWPLLKLLKIFNSLVHNFGVAIILLTILVKLLFYPLSVKSLRSMKEMQKIQPKIAELKEKYGDDKQRLSQEQMSLMKSHKVNPLGGCLPMLVQIPVFLALYAVLGNSIELFHAPFFGWIHDLSAKDPYYIYPILMGLSMAAQQKLTPSPGMDPAQQKMMMVMPVVFSFVMLGLPSGLTLYIFVSTLIGMLQSYMMKREKPSSAELSEVTS